MGTVYSDTWSWLKVDEKDELVLNGHIKKRLKVTVTNYELANKALEVDK